MVVVSLAHFLHSHSYETFVLGTEVFTCLVCPDINLKSTNQEKICIANGTVYFLIKSDVQVRLLSLLSCVKAAIHEYHHEPMEEGELPCQGNNFFHIVLASFVST